MSVIERLDPATKRIYLAAGVRQYHPVADVYRELRSLRRTDPALRGFDMPVVAAGNLPKGGGRFTPRFATFRQGWKVVPENVSHTLYVSGEQITDDGQAGPAAIDTTLLSPGVNVVVHYEPPAAEIILVQTGSVTEQNLAEIAERVWAQAPSQRGQPIPNFTVVMTDSDGTPRTGLEVTGRSCRDSGPWEVLINPVREIGRGAYAVDLAGTETDGVVVTLEFTAPGLPPRLLTILPDS